MFLKLNEKRRYASPVAILLLLIFITAGSSNVYAQQVNEVITDFGGFWKSGTGTAINPTRPNTSHNVLSFKYNTQVYSTGVDDNKLTTNSIPYTPGDYRAFPVGTVGGTVTSGASIFIALASRYDGVPNGYSNPLPSLKIKDVLIDGIHGLDLGTGATNIPASSLISFPISSVTTAAIADAKPDILVSQIAQPTASGDTLYFVNSSGVVVGNKLGINWTTINNLGTYYLDLYSLPGGVACNTAQISGTSDKETTREIRLIAFKLSDFGITAANAADVATFILKASGSSDPAFISYNSDAFTIPAPVISAHPTSQVVCPNVGNSATFSVTATGGSLSYQWRKDNVDIPGATSASYTIPSVTIAHTGAYNVVISNPIGSVVSTIAYLNVSIAVQPTPSSQLIATGASAVLSISANNATSYQWRENGVNIPGATSATYTSPAVTNTNVVNYSVLVINSAHGGCANVLSNTVTIQGSKTLYSKPSVNLHIPGSWGVEPDGSGSSPVDFTRSEHTFIIKNNASTGGNLTIAGTLDLASAIATISAGTTLDAAKLIRSGTGTIAGTATSGLTVRDTADLYFKTGNAILKTLTIHNGVVNLMRPLDIAAGPSAGSLVLLGGKFNTNDQLTFKSNSTGTARLAPITPGAVLTGSATIERYLPAARGWRYLSVPISSVDAPTINEAWQEGATTSSLSPNPNPGYGGFINGGIAANGFDASSTNSPTIKIFDNRTNAFVRLPANPGTNIPITSYPAYSVYFRGDRSINLMQGLNAAITSTTLRIKGGINTGDQVIPVNATGYTLVGNPFPSPLDLTTITRNNVKNTIYIWDPKMAGSYGLGGYVTLSWNSNTNSYDKTTSVSPVDEHIQSGEAFLVSSQDQVNPGSLIIKETDKSAGGNDMVFRSASEDQRMAINLYSSVNDTLSLLDGVLTTFADVNSNLVNNDDARKLYGSNQSINLHRKGQTLAIERRKTITENDTTFLNIYQMKVMQYKLEIKIQNMHTGNLIPVLKDNYSFANNGMPLNTNGTTIVPFSVTSDPASYAVNRFSIVFDIPKTLPVTFTSVSAFRNEKDILVKWKVENEINIVGYDVEKSKDGISFYKLISVDQGNMIAPGTYQVTDKEAGSGNHYYRIRSREIDASMSLSNTVLVVINKNEHLTALRIYPNPVNSQSVIQADDLAEGIYNLNIYDLQGILVQSTKFKHRGGNLHLRFIADKKLAPGVYQVELKCGEMKIHCTALVN